MWSKKARTDEEFVVNLNEDNLTCNESIEASSLWENQVLPNPSLGTVGELDGFSISDLENADLGTPPDFLTVRSSFIIKTFENHYKFRFSDFVLVGFAVGFSGELVELDWMAVIGLDSCLQNKNL